MMGSRLLTSDGSARYHDGVCPAAMDDAICAAKADCDEMANWTDSEGIAVARTLRTDCWTEALFAQWLAMSN